MLVTIFIYFSQNRTRPTFVLNIILRLNDTLRILSVSTRSPRSNKTNKKNLVKHNVVMAISTSRSEERGFDENSFVPLSTFLDTVNLRRVQKHASGFVFAVKLRGPNRNKGGFDFWYSRAVHAQLTAASRVYTRRWSILSLRHSPPLPPPIRPSFSYPLSLSSLSLLPPLPILPWPFAHNIMDTKISPGRIIRERGVSSD